jgi:cytochrome bd-type quinol oxidase subunit 2
MFFFGVLLSCVVIIAGVVILVLGRHEWKFNSQLLFISVAMVLVALLQLCYWVVRKKKKKKKNFCCIILNYLGIVCNG